MAEKKYLKFLFCSADKFPPFRVDVAVLFGDEMASRGHKIDWVLQSDQACSKSYQTTWSGGRVWVGRTDLGENRLSRLKKHVYNILHACRLLSLSCKNKYDFIQVKDQFVAGVLGLIAARLNDTRFYYWLSYPFPEASLYAADQGTARYPFFYRARGIFFKFLLYKIILPLSDHVFVQSEQMKVDVASQGIAEEKLSVVPMGVNLKKFIQFTESNTDDLSDYEEECIVYLGTLIRERRIDFLIRVVSQVRRDRPKAKLYLVGGGEDQEDIDLLMREARRLGIEEAVKITGFLPQEEALKYVRKASVCVSPFYPTPILNSTSPTKVVEYMALGMPVVANDHPEQRMVINESSGGLCVPYEEKAFASAITRILDDPDEAKAMGESGRRYVTEKRSYEKIADMLEEQYFNICTSIENNRPPIT